MGRAAGLRHVPRIRGAAQLHGPQRHIAHPLTQKYPRFKAHHGMYTSFNVRGSEGVPGAQGLGNTWFITPVEFALEGQQDQIVTL